MVGVRPLPDGRLVLAADSEEDVRLLAGLLLRLLEERGEASLAAQAARHADAEERRRP